MKMAYSNRLTQEGLVVSLSSVKRTLTRCGLVYPSKWKKWHVYPPRPIPHAPGILVEIDSMQEGLASAHLHYYNTERPHMALGMKTPLEVITSY